MVVIRRNVLRTAVTACAAVFSIANVIGCGGNDDGGTTGGCEWFAADNCWKQSVEAAVACAAPSSEVGALSTDGLSCTFTDGTEVTFATSLDEMDIDYLWNFEITQDGAFCMSFVESDEDSMELSTSLGTARVAVAGQGIQITCPDGTSYTGQAADLGECMDDLPGTSSGAPPYHFSLWGGSSQEQDLFNCSR